MKYLGSQERETNRLVLKPQTMEEQKYLWEVLMIPEVNRYFLTVPPKLRDKLRDWKKQETYYQEDMKHAFDKDVFRWSIFLKETGECIGRLSCQENGEGIEDPSIRDVGWLIDPRYQGKGYGTEAAYAMIDYMFCEVGISEIRTGAAILNPASWKIMEKLGFIRQQETKWIQYTFLDAPVEDYCYHITKEEWLKKKENLSCDKSFKKKRRVTHANATVCYLKKDNQVLMIKFSKKWGQVSAPPGGKFETGESPLDCILREFYEETGLTLIHPKLQGISYWKDSSEGIIFVYTASDFKGVLKTVSKEGRLEWISLEDLSKIKQFDQNQKFTPYLFQKKLFEGKFLLDDSCNVLEYEIRNM